MARKIELPRVELRKTEDLEKADTNIRSEYSEGGMKLLMESIARVGLLELPKITPENKVFSGWGRVEACKRLGLEEIPVIVMDVPESEQVALSIVENFCRENVYREDLRKAISHLYHNRSLSLREIQEMTGIDKGTLSTLLAIEKLPPLIKEKAKGLPIYKALEVKKLLDKVPEEEREEVGQEVIKLAEREPLARLREITRKAEKKGSVKAEVQRALEEGKRVVITITIPEVIYRALRERAGWNKTIQELIVDILRECLDLDR